MLCQCLVAGWKLGTPKGLSGKVHFSYLCCSENVCITNHRSKWIPIFVPAHGAKMTATRNQTSSKHEGSEETRGTLWNYLRNIENNLNAGFSIQIQHLLQYLRTIYNILQPERLCFDTTCRWLWSRTHTVPQEPMWKPQQLRWTPTLANKQTAPKAELSLSKEQNIETKVSIWNLYAEPLRRTFSGGWKTAGNL